MTSSPSPSPANPIRLAIIGCGGICQRIYAPILQAMPEQVTVAAVCDLNLEYAQQVATQFFPQAHVSGDAVALLQTETLDAVMVLTSERANAKTAALVLRESPLPIFQEKPPATTLADFQALLKTESHSPGLVYTAFNRRHMPLFQNLEPLASPLVKVTGSITRVGREVSEFPYTCIHLLDSLQYYSRSRFASAAFRFSTEPIASWHLGGRLENGAACELTFIPDGPGESEYLFLETKDERLELHFPDSDGVAPQARLVQEKNGKKTEILSDFSQPSFEVMGYAPAFRDFLHRLHTGHLADSPHRLPASQRTIEVLEAMVAAAEE